MIRNISQDFTVYSEGRVLRGEEGTPIGTMAAFLESPASTR
jgi:hypothetical protein